MNPPWCKTISIYLRVENSFITSPLRLVEQLSKFYETSHCVVSLSVFSDNMVAVTLCDEKVVAKVQSRDEVILYGQHVKYTIIQTNVISVRVSMPQRDIFYNDVIKALKGYGQVFHTDVQKENDCRQLYALIDLKKDISSPMKVKNMLTCDVTVVG